jgi:hypothetical protein
VTVGEAFAALDAMSAQMVRTRASSDALELIVTNEHGDVVERPAINRARLNPLTVFVSGPLP